MQAGWGAGGVPTQRAANLCGVVPSDFFAFFLGSSTKYGCTLCGCSIIQFPLPVVFLVVVQKVHRSPARHIRLVRAPPAVQKLIQLGWAIWLWAVLLVPGYGFAHNASTGQHCGHSTETLHVSSVRHAVCLQGLALSAGLLDRVGKATCFAAPKVSKSGCRGRNGKGACWGIMRGCSSGTGGTAVLGSALGHCTAGRC